MNKLDLIRSVSEKSGVTQADVKPIIDAVWETISETVASGEGVLVHGFGKFECRTRAPRVGKNPLTGKMFEVPAKNVPWFTPGKEFKQTVCGE